MPRLLSPATLLLVCWVFPVLVRSAETPDAVAEGKAFSCRGRASGYYADLQTGCQRYHMCDAGGRRYSYACPNQTLFQQRVMICDHWFMVDCALSETFFGANALLGQPGRRFVDDNEPFFVKSQEETTQRRRAHARRPVDRTSAAYLASLAERPGTTATDATRQPSTPRVGQLGPAKIAPDKVTPTKFAAATSSETRTLPRAYVDNPFFRSLTPSTRPATTPPSTPSSRAPQLRDRWTSGQRETPTTLPPTAQTMPTSARTIPTSARTLPTSAQTIPTSARTIPTSPQTFANPAQTLTNPAQTLANPAQTLASPRGQAHLFLADDLVAWTTSAPPLGAARDLHEEELSGNTVELRFPDPRRMFFIADTAVEEAEMLRANHETVLRIALTAPAHNAAMRFGGSRRSRGRGDECPHCHPAFLFPGTCQPCVLIR